MFLLITIYRRWNCRRTFRSFAYWVQTYKTTIKSFNWTIFALTLHLSLFVIVISNLFFSNSKLNGFFPKQKCLIRKIIINICLQLCSQIPDITKKIIHVKTKRYKFHIQNIPFPYQLNFYCFLETLSPYTPTLLEIVTQA